MRKQSQYRIVFLFVMVVSGAFLWIYWGLWSPGGKVDSQLKTGLVISRVANIQIEPAITFPDRSYVRGVALLYNAKEQEWGVGYTVLTEAKWEDIVRYYKQCYNRHPIKWLAEGTESLSEKAKRLGFAVFEGSTKQKVVFTLSAGAPLSRDIEDFELGTEEQKHFHVIAVYIEVPLLGEIQRRGGYLPITVPVNH
jgi:hypothetical protein